MRLLLIAMLFAAPTVAPVVVPKYPDWMKRGIKWKMCTQLVCTEATKECSYPGLPTDCAATCLKRYISADGGIYCE